MFFHRHKGDLGELERGAKRAMVLWEWWKTGGKECVGNPHQEKRKANVYGERKRYLCSSAFHLWMTSRTATASQEEDVREINCSLFSDCHHRYFLKHVCIRIGTVTFPEIHKSSTCLYCQIQYICKCPKLINNPFVETRSLQMCLFSSIFIYLSLLFPPQSPKVRPFSAMDGVPFFLSRVKAETPEDLLVHDLHFHTQTEPVDLSINKPRPSSSSTTPTTALSSSPLRSAFSPSSLSSSSSSSSSSPSVITSASSVLTSGPLVPPGSGVRGQPYLHILHSVPPPPSSPLSLPGAGKLASHVHRIPVVVQSLPLMYTSAVRSPSSLNNAIMLPLLDEVKGQGKGGTTQLDWLCIRSAWVRLQGLLIQLFH